jgi:hypothetical protein
MSDKLISRSNGDDDATPLEHYNGKKTFHNLVSLDTLFNPRTIKLINNKVFKGNESEFRQFIQHLDSYQSWQESLKLIETELTRRNIKQNDQGAVMLTNIVYRRYYPHDDGVKID